MQYQVISTAEIDGPLNQQPGWCVAEIPDDGGEGRIVAGPFPSEGTAQAKADLMLIGRQRFIEDYVDDFVRDDHIWTKTQLKRTLESSQLTETERDAVITEVLEAQDSVATFHRGRAIGCFDADLGGCVA